jgi:hypothetical protein
MVKMRLKIKPFFLLIAIFATTFVTFAQNTGSNSPYGRYGFGLLSNPTFGASEAMGGISYGLRRSQQVNPGNPASYSVLDSLTFVFDFGLSGQMARMNDGTHSRDFYNGNFDYVAIQFPILHNMAASVGLLPFSKVGYNFGALRAQDNIQYVETYRGTGGLNEIYGGIAWEPVQNFSVGANISFLFGNFSHSSVLTPLVNNASIRETKHTYSIRDMKFDFGVQQTFPLDDIRSITFGAVYSPQISTTADVTPSRMMFASDPFQNPWQRPLEILPSDTLRGASFQLPHSFGLGFTYSTNNFLVGVDGEYQLWKGLDYPDALDGLTRDTRFNDTYRIASGVEYVINPYGQQFLERIRFRVGASFANSYLNVNVFNPENSNHIGISSFKEYGVNVGLGLPFHHFMSGRMSMINIGFGYTRQQPDNRLMIAQDMFKISVNMNINELWFMKHLMP